KQRIGTLRNPLQRPPTGRALAGAARERRGVIRSHPRWTVTPVPLLSLGVGSGLGAGVGQQSPPADNKGLDAKVESTIDLAPDFPGYQLRLRTITFEPGGVAGFHSHKDRPAFAYVLQGTLTELRQGG